MAPPTIFKIFLVLSVANTFASVFGDNQTDQPDSFAQFDHVIRDNLKEFQLRMKKGFPDLNLTSFNPLIMGPRNFKKQNENVAVSLNVKQINIFGLVSFDYEMKRRGNSSIILDLTLPYLTAQGLYKMTGKAYKIFPLSGEGGYVVNVKGAAMSLVGKFSEADSKVIFQADDIESDYGMLTVRLENYVGGTSVSGLVQPLLPLFGKAIVAHIEPTMESRMKSVLNKMVNEILSKDEAQALAKNLFLG